MRTGEWKYFCPEHRRQPIAWVFVFVFTVLAGWASIYSAFLQSPKNDHAESLKKDRLSIARSVFSSVRNDLEVTIPVALGMQDRIKKRQFVTDPDQFASIYAPTVSLPATEKIGLLSVEVVSAVDEYRRRLSECAKHRETYVGRIRKSGDDRSANILLLVYCVSLDSVIRTGKMVLSKIWREFPDVDFGSKELPEYRIIEESIRELEDAVNQRAGAAKADVSK